MALDSDALVSLEEARTYLQTEAEGKPVTEWLELAINGLSLRVLQHTGRTYINPDKADKATVREYSFDPSDRILAIDNCRGISLVRASATPKDVDSWNDVEADLWLAEPLGEAVTDRIRFLSPADLPAIGTGWGLLGLHASRESSQRSEWPHQVRAELHSRATLQVTAKWGYGASLATVPGNVKLAVLMWLQNIHKRDAAFFGEQAKVFADLAMPRDVRELLDGEGTSRPLVDAV